MYIKGFQISVSSVEQSHVLCIVNLVFVGAIYPDVCEFSEAAMSSVDGGHV